MIEEGEIIEIPVENPTYFTKAKQQEIGIIVFSSLTVVLLLLAITIRNKPENVSRRKELKKEIEIQPLNGNNLRIFSLDPLDQDEITMNIFFCISVLMPIFNIDSQY